MNRNHLKSYKIKIINNKRYKNKSITKPYVKKFQILTNSHDYYSYSNGFAMSSCVKLLLYKVGIP